MTPQEDQTVRGLLDAYRQGFFPMADPGRPRRPDTGSRIVWLNPDPRAILPLGGFHIPRSLRRRVRSGRFRITSDEAFEDVIRACAEPRWYERGTWIDDWIIQAYTLLHRAGHAHSIEAWLTPTHPSPERQQGIPPPQAPPPPDRQPSPAPSPPGTSRTDVLVGGVYGVAIGAAFFAESMFCRPDAGGTDASKVALVHLVHHLRRRGFALLDVQFWNEHLERFGCVEIPRRAYLEALAEALAVPIDWPPFEPARTVAEMRPPGADGPPR